MTFIRSPYDFVLFADLFRPIRWLHFEKAVRLSIEWVSYFTRVNDMPIYDTFLNCSHLYSQSLICLDLCSAAILVFRYYIEVTTDTSVSRKVSLTYFIKRTVKVIYK